MEKKPHICKMYGVTKTELLKHEIFTTTGKGRKLDVILERREIHRMCFGCDKKEDVIEFATSFDGIWNVFDTLENAEKHFLDLLER